jgi:hypothetical protein
LVIPINHLFVKAVIVVPINHPFVIVVVVVVVLVVVS